MESQRKLTNNYQEEAKLMDIKNTSTLGNQASLTEHTNCLSWGLYTLEQSRDGISDNLQCRGRVGYTVHPASNQAGAGVGGSK